jgi:hypothetical protein
VPQRIAAALPEVRLVALIRHPTDRCIARYVARRRDGLEPARSIGEIIEREQANGIDLDNTAGTYLAAGHVASILQQYLDIFGQERVKIIFHDDLLADTAGVLADIFAFIGVDPAYRVDTSIRHNASGGNVRGLKGQLWRASARSRQMVRPVIPKPLRDAAFRAVTRNLDPVTISSDERELLDAYYVDEVQQLSAVVGRDVVRRRHSFESRPAGVLSMSAASTHIATASIGGDDNEIDCSELPRDALRGTASGGNEGGTR